MITVLGKAGIKVTVLAHSINEIGVVFITYEIEYPRLILAELNTHRMESKNSFSSRAVPFEKMLAQLTGQPVRFGANQAGMQDKGEDFSGAVEIFKFTPDKKKKRFAQVNLDFTLDIVEATPVEAWEEAKNYAIAFASAFKEAGYHKQVYNRLLEPFQMMKTVISGTEWENFFWLRDDDAADPTLRELAHCMKEAESQSTPVPLKAGQWHLPYVDTVIDGDVQRYFLMLNDGEVQEISLNEAVKVSCARCAAVSYRNEGYGLEKSIELYDRLVGSDKKHASALEHCATPMKPPYIAVGFKDCINLNPWPPTWEPGVTHADRKGHLWSGNLKEWIQHRKLIPGENYEGA